MKFETYPDLGAAGLDGVSFVITIRNPIQHSTTVKIVPLDELSETVELKTAGAPSIEVRN